MSAFSWFSRTGVSISEQALGDEAPGLLPVEVAMMAGAVPSRVREFAAGRACARRAMAALGADLGPIGIAPDRTPEWPAGFGGSITHSDTHCAAAVFRRGQGILSIGIDLEPAEPLDEDLLPEVCRTEELAWLRPQSPAHRLLLARAIFSAKESAYKCQYSATRQPLEFADVGIELFLDRDAFVATLLTGAGDFPPGTRVCGEIRITAAHIACVALLDEDR